MTSAKNYRRSIGFFVSAKKERGFYMLTSLAVIFLTGILLSQILKRVGLPSLIGMLLTGIIIGPYAFNLLDSTILTISPDLRQLALVIILMRAGLSLDLNDLKKAGRPAMLLCFVPACFEIAATLFIAPRFFGVSLLDAAIIGSVIAAVSPAVVVPSMLKLMEEGYGTNKSIPQMIMAGASVDDIFVIVLFTTFTTLASSGSFSPSSLLNIPISIVLGLALGTLVGWLVSVLFRKIPLNNSIKVIILLSLAFLMLAFENLLKGTLSVSGLLAVMAMGVVVFRIIPTTGENISASLSRLWVGAEILLFVLVGATVDVKYALSYGFSVVGFLLLVLAFRMLGVYVSLIGTNLTTKERIFTMVAYIPKATVQAAIGGIPLAMGLECGSLVLTIAVLSILITAPLGAIGIDFLYKKLLNKS